MLLTIEYFVIRAKSRTMQMQSPFNRGANTTSYHTAQCRLRGNKEIN